MLVSRGARQERGKTVTWPLGSEHAVSHRRPSPRPTRVVHAASAITLYFALYLTSYVKQKCKVLKLLDEDGTVRAQPIGPPLAKAFMVSGVMACSLPPSLPE